MLLPVVVDGKSYSEWMLVAPNLPVDVVLSMSLLYSNFSKIVLDTDDKRLLFTPKELVKEFAATTIHDSKQCSPIRTEINKSSTVSENPFVNMVNKFKKHFTSIEKQANGKFVISFTLPPFRIRLNDYTPISCKPNRYEGLKLKFLTQECKKMKDDGRTVPSTSEFGLSPV